MDERPPPPPQQIIIRQETSTGTKVGIWIIVALLATPIVVALICCAGIGASSQGS